MDHFPDSGQWAGQTLPAQPVVSAMLTQKEGNAELMGLDGVSRLYAFTPVEGQVDTGIHLAVGLPLQAAYAQTDQLFARNLAWLGLVSALALAAAWFGSDALVLRRVRALVSATDRLRQGDLSARTGLPYGREELSQLARAFDEMGQVLQQREAEARQANASLHAEREWLRVTLASIGDGVITTDTQGNVTFVNAVAQALTGWTQAEAAGQPIETVFHIVNEQTRAAVESPVRRVMRDGQVAGLANHTVLITKMGQAIPIDDSGAPIHDDAGRLQGVVLVFRDVSERRRAETALRESHARLERDELAQRILADASRVLADSPDYQVRLEKVAQVAVPRLADWCAVSVVDLETEEIRPATVAHVDPARVALADELQRRYPPNRDPERGVAKVVQTGQAELFAEITDAMLVAGAQDAEHLRILRDLSFRSAMIVPLIARGRALGAMTFVWAESGKQYTPADLGLAEALAYRAALALDNARLYERAQRLNRELEQRVAERTEKIRQNERLLADAQHLARLGSWQWDVAANRVTWSEELYRIYGLEPETFGATFEGYLAHVHPEDQSIARTAIEGALHDHRPFTFEERIVRPDGSRRTLYSQGHVVLDDAGQPARLVGICQDVTERKQIEEDLRGSREQLRQLSSRLQAAREEERTRIARELHDELGGAMTSLKMELARLHRVVPQPETAIFTETVQSMAVLIDATVQTVRRIATDLRPGLLDDLGLVAAIEWQLSEFAKRTGIKCRLDSRVETVDLHPDSATGIFRVFQEALTNVARHAQAACVETLLEEIDGHLVLEVRDNGRGISEPELLGAKSLGVLGMRERVRSLAGEIIIHGLPGQGTTVRLSIPLGPPSAQIPASS